jgi:tetratricopeptide (TPR) repeat protein
LPDPREYEIETAKAKGEDATILTWEHVKAIYGDRAFIFEGLISKGFRIYECHYTTRDDTGLMRDSFVSIMSREPLNTRSAYNLIPVGNDPFNKFDKVIKNTQTTYFSHIVFNDNGLYASGRETSINAYVEPCSDGVCIYFMGENRDDRPLARHYGKVFVSKTGGYLGAWNSIDMWKSLSNDERSQLRVLAGEYYGIRLTNGTVLVDNDGRSYVDRWAVDAITKGFYGLSVKIIEFLEEKFPDDERLNSTYYYAARAYYNQRESDTTESGMPSDYFWKREKAKDYYSKDISLFLRLASSRRTPDQCRSFKELAIMLEKEGDISEAIKCARLASSAGIDDGTKGGFEGRVARLEKKLAAKAKKDV